MKLKARDGDSNSAVFSSSFSSIVICNRAKELLSDIESGRLHQYAKQKGYQALVGTTNISTEEVEYILTLKNSAQCLSDYVLARKYLEKIESRGNTLLCFKPKYRPEKKRLTFPYKLLSLIE